MTATTTLFNQKELIECITSKDWRGRAVGTLGLSAYPGDTSREALIDSLDDPVWLVRANAIDSLTDIGNTEPLPHLVELLLHDPVYVVRAGAVRALRRCGQEGNKALIDALKDSEWLVRAQAALALGQPGNTRGIKPLAVLLRRDDNYVVRRSAAFSLGCINKEDAVPALVAALEDESLFVQITAALSLGIIGGDTALRALIPLQEHRSAGMRWAAEWGLTRHLDPDLAPDPNVILQSTNPSESWAATWALNLMQQSVSLE